MPQHTKMKIRLSFISIFLLITFSLSMALEERKDSWKAVYSCPSKNVEIFLFEKKTVYAEVAIKDGARHSEIKSVFNNSDIKDIVISLEQLDVSRLDTNTDNGGEWRYLKFDKKALFYSLDDAASKKLNEILVRLLSINTSQE